jgi:hypothetical protein
MSNIKNPENINDSYSPKPSGSISDSDKFGYQPTRSSGGTHQIHLNKLHLHQESPKTI